MDRMEGAKAETDPSNMGALFMKDIAMQISWKFFNKDFIIDIK